MTTQELDEILVREKEIAQKALGCDMCKKYARCLYCFSRDEYPCARAHERLFSAISLGRKIPAYLLPEPPVEEPQPAPDQPVKPAVSAKPAAVKPVKTAEERSEQREPNEEMIETVAHILAEFNMNSLSEERARELKKISAMMDSTDETSSVLFRTQRLEGDTPIIKISRKKR